MTRRLWALLVLVLLAGCGAGSQPHLGGPSSGAPAVVPTSSSAGPPVSAPTSCPDRLHDIVAHATGRGNVGARTQRSSGLLRCSYTAAHPRPSVCAGATVLINTEAHAFTDFQRWTVETGQNAMWTGDAALNPRPVPGIGIEAEWVPKTRTFDTATANAWISVFLDCPAVPAATALRLGRSLGRAGLGTVH